MSNLKQSRAVNVQVPGEAPKQPGLADAGAPAAGQSLAPQVDTAKPEAGAPAFDIDALRAQIRAEEQDRARAELGAQIHAAASVINSPAPTIAGARHDYRRMRAADIDHTRLTAPVLSLDGWVCPPAPEAKK